MKPFNSWKTPTALTAIGLVSMGLCMIETARVAIKIYEEDYIPEAQEAYKDKRPIDRLYIAKRALPKAVSPIIFGAGAAFCFISANKLHMRREATLIGALAGVSEGYRLYSDHVRREAPETDRNAREEGFEKTSMSGQGMPKYMDVSETRRWYDKWSRRFFHASTEDVITASYNLNRQFIGKGEASYNDYCRVLDNSEMPPTRDGDDEGWCDYADAFYGYRWIDIDYIPKVDSNGDYTEIVFPFPPTTDYKDILE